MSRRKHCGRCNSTGWYQYSTSGTPHMKVCEQCCKHDEGFWKLKVHYGDDNGKWCCKAGCGKLEDKRPKNTDYNGKPVENVTLLEL